MPLQKPHKNVHVIIVFLYESQQGMSCFLNLSRMSRELIFSPRSFKYRIAAKGTVPLLANRVLVSCIASNNDLSTHFHTPSSPFSISEQRSQGNVVCRTTDLYYVMNKLKLCVLCTSTPINTTIKLLVH